MLLVKVCASLVNYRDSSFFGFCGVISVGGINLEGEGVGQWGGGVVKLLPSNYNERRLIRAVTSERVCVCFWAKE